MTEGREWLGVWTVSIDRPERLFQGVLTYSHTEGGELKLSKENAYQDELRYLDGTSFIPVIKGYEHHSGKHLTI